MSSTCDQNVIKIDTNKNHQRMTNKNHQRMTKVSLPRENVVKMSSICDQNVVNKSSTSRQQVVNKSPTSRQQVVTKSSPCRHHVVTMSSPCRHHVVTMSSTCRQHVVKMSSTCRQHVVNMSSNVWAACDQRALQRVSALLSLPWGRTQTLDLQLSVFLVVALISSIHRCDLLNSSLQLHKLESEMICRRGAPEYRTLSAHFPRCQRPPNFRWSTRWPSVLIYFFVRSEGYLVLPDFRRSTR